MSLDHKAYAFHWLAFEQDNLFGILAQALVQNDAAPLLSYIQQNFHLLKDPYEGDPLQHDWQETLEASDVHTFGDYALTRFYDPSDNFGLSHDWEYIYDSFPKHALIPVLGVPFGPRDNEFNPGRYGSYFQTPSQVELSLLELKNLHVSFDDSQRSSVKWFLEGLHHCVSKRLGLYITF